MLLGETALDEIVAKEKENKINAQPYKPKAQDEDSDSGLEFEEPADG